MISVRRIRIGEGELFKQMRLTSLRESPSAFASTYESALRRSPESWSEQTDSTAQGSDRSTFIAFSGDSPIGIAALYRTGEETKVGELLQVWVSPEYRSQGVAVDLMDAVFQWAGENGFRTVIVTVAKGNTRALRFYRKYGFKPSNIASLDGSDDPVVLMKEVEHAHASDALPRAGDA
jgi:ribosomal protein S18 acetylase RimI-like enzyme